MGFDPENIIRQKFGIQNRKKNLEESSEYHAKQDEMVFSAFFHSTLTIQFEKEIAGEKIKIPKVLGQHTTASRIYNYLLEHEFITPKTQITSIRRSLDTLKNQGKIIQVEDIEHNFSRVSSVLTTGTETVYTICRKKETKVNQQGTLY